MSLFLSSFFQDGLKAVDNLKPSIEKLATDLHTVRRTQHLFCLFWFHVPCVPYLCPLEQIKQVQDEERKQLTQLRDVLKSSLQVEQKEVTHTHTRMHPSDGVWCVLTFEMYTDPHSSPRSHMQCNPDLIRGSFGVASVNTNAYEF